MADIQLPENFVLHNRTRIEGDVAYLTLTQGYEAVIDAKDVELVGAYCWRASVANHTIYAKTWMRMPCGKRKTVFLHRVLMSPPSGLFVDHIDHDGLNNRRCNLRIANHSENMRNSRLHKDGTSGFKGVYWRPDRKKWRVQIVADGHAIFLGLFDCPRKGHEAYVEAAKRLHGDFACFK